MLLDESKWRTLLCFLRNISDPCLRNLPWSAVPWSMFIDVQSTTLVDATRWYPNFSNKFSWINYHPRNMEVGNQQWIGPPHSNSASRSRHYLQCTGRLDSPNRMVNATGIWAKYQPFSHQWFSPIHQSSIHVLTSSSSTNHKFRTHDIILHI